MIDFSSSGCTYLDVRLTFRSADSSGILEVCNQRRQWSIACADNQVSQSIAMVACNQLGYNSNFVRSTRIASTSASIVNNGRPSIFLENINGLACTGNETSLANCLNAVPVEPSPPPLGRRKRIADDDESPLVCNLVTRLQCGGKWIIIFVKCTLH